MLYLTISKKVIIEIKELTGIFINLKYQSEACTYNLGVRHELEQYFDVKKNTNKL